MKWIKEGKRAAEKKQRQDRAGENGHEPVHTHGDRQSYGPGKDGFQPFFALRLVISALLFACGLLLKLPGAWNTLLVVISAVVAGYDVLYGAVMCLLRKRFFDAKVLMTIAAAAAFIIGENHEGAGVMILFQFSIFLQSYAVSRARRSVQEAMGEQPELVTVVRGGKEFTVRVSDVAVGETVIIGPGERIAFDSVVLEGESALDMSSLTGEGTPLPVRPEDELYSGAVNLSGMLRAGVQAKADESTAARIMNTVQEESDRQGRTETFITRFTAIYTPIVIALAVLTAVCIPLFSDVTFTESLHRALVLLVLSCPCALALAAPVAYFAGIGGAARKGILFKNSAAVDTAADTGTVVFDKTGTLTTGNFRVISVKSDRMDAQTLLKIAAHAESYSDHPVARSILAAYEGTIYIELIESFVEYPGKGVTVKVDGVEIMVGTAQFLISLGVDIPEEDILPELSVFMGVGGTYAGRIVLDDVMKEDAAKAVRELEEDCLCKVAMLTEDGEAAADKVAGQLEIAAYHVAGLPENIPATGKHRVVFIGEGLHDAPALLAADMSVAMGGLGSDAVAEGAEVILLDGMPSKAATMIRSARGIRRIVLENLCIALGIKLAVLLLALFGVASEMWLALIVDMGAALLAVCNGIRAWSIIGNAKILPGRSK